MLSETLPCCPSKAEAQQPGVLLTTVGIGLDPDPQQLQPRYHSTKLSPKATMCSQIKDAF